MNNIIVTDIGYLKELKALAEKVRASQTRAALSVNKEMIELYWFIGSRIITLQESKGWGAKVVDQLSKDLIKEFPEMKGFSTRNLKYMRQFAEEYSDFEFVQQAAAQLPWFHNIILLQRIKDIEERTWYINETIKNGWSRGLLERQIENDLYHRQAISTGKSTNFTNTLPSPYSNLAEEVIKSPYNLDFLTVSSEAREREIERGLVAQ